MKINICGNILRHVSTIWDLVSTCKNCLYQTWCQAEISHNEYFLYLSAPIKIKIPINAQGGKMGIFEEWKYTYVGSIWDIFQLYEIYFPLEIPVYNKHDVKQKFLIVNIFYFWMPQLKSKSPIMPKAEKWGLSRNENIHM